MITYALRCAPGGHGFDGWFRSSEDFERQRARGLVSCPACGATDVEKAMMAPAVSAAREGGVPSPETRRAVLQKLQSMAREMRASGENVGSRFAEEARRIHYGETAERGIYGEASPPEVKGLMEEGIVVMPLPPLPEDAN